MTEIPENVVYNCDFMKNRLPDHCADLIIADPPYFQYKGDFDFVWPTFDDYLNDVRRWGEECRRLLKDNGTLIWWGSDNRIAYTQVILDTMFQFLNSCTWDKSNGWGKVQNAEISRKFIPNAERFILYESRPEIREGEARKILRVFEYEQGMCRTRCMKPLVDYMISEMERAGFTPKHVNDALHTYMAGHWFTRGSQWELPTRENYERLRNLFNGDRPNSEYLCRDYEELRKDYEELRKDYEELRKDYEELRKDYEELRKDYEELRRPFNLPERSTDVLQFPQDSGASKRYGHDTVKGDAITSYLIQVTTRPGALVVVPFAGSGTECAMAAKLGRRFVGYEIDPKHARTAARRTEKFIQTTLL